MGNKINRTDIYPNTTPADADHVIGTDVSNVSNDSNGETVTFTIQSILATQHDHTLSDITDAGTAAGNDTGDFAAASHTHTLSDITDAGTAAANDTGDFATAAQGALADSAQQPPSEGAFVDGDKTKLDGIEANADVTDTANVTAAGALMDSEVTNLAQVKAFDSTDYATAAQGALADTAVQPGDDADALGSGSATDGQVLTADGAGNAAWEDAAGGGGLVFLASSDLSSDATSDFTAFDAGLYDAYEFVFQNIIPATDDVDFTFLSSTDGGSTWDDTSGDYDFGCIILRSGTVFDTDSGNAASIALTGTGALTIGNTSGYPGLSGRLFVPGPHLAKKTQFLWNTSFYDPSGNLVMLTGSGLRQSEADVNAVRFLCSSGNIASGTITMYGMVSA
ncbi:hypothetical protein PVV74_17310 [Roseovarius sp. SK2]|uniref:hypothetical protein n=1 Tax=Roseovarius TaxID=74030 RepID=UPI00237AB520|nr:hypothetical protein [Roseovarius sp. SK2]MDD9727222.1 hypothetical protein [Roseovarius sp. SK2]